MWPAKHTGEIELSNPSTAILWDIRPELLCGFLKSKYPVSAWVWLTKHTVKIDNQINNFVCQTRATY